ncbi:potassium transporter TrkG [Arthrobacter sp. zg-Y1219]|uniref:TrkH family potassium uptake protein n=1 Tax=Arthrobacter sp. zg-Y1219 TaxID=3049067 RepID=UPI0024C38ED7|nr:potassium transporter TrkG [Arthrobacter sp. zg-Y1219]MDK1358678.1 potassium transporter TrkG [Arthrobacter sp. zg-Y1219]
MGNRARLLPRRRKPLRPARSVFLGFLAADLAGTGLLTLPAASTESGGAPIMVAFFTSTSSLCVTGLGVVDTPVYWTGFGQAVMLALIQLGGFGVMSFASVVALTVMHRLSLRSKVTFALEGNKPDLSHVPSVIAGVAKITLLVEGIVGLMLAARFWLSYGRSPGEALWLGAFHAVSAFNNAGFALFSDSLVQYATDPAVSLPICAAVILGGLGFPVLVQLRRDLRIPRRWSMNTRLVLAGSAVLLLAGTVFITALEWDNPRTLGPLDWPSKLLTGFFQSVQTRTSGFYSVDIAALDGATLLVMDALMFIGAGPAGTGGGVKITTAAVLFFILAAEVRGRRQVNVLGKSLSPAVYRQAIAVLVLSVLFVGTATGILLVLTGFPLESVLFEAVSAFATVGLSTGITAHLPAAGQLILIVLMFAGRLGPLLFASALALRDRPLHYELPIERPIIG